MSLLRDLQLSGEDYEWYPTTAEIMTCISNDIYSCAKSRDKRFLDFSTIKDYVDDNYVELLPMSFLDIGTGDGTVLNHFLSSSRYRVEPYGIELSRIHGNNLIRSGVCLLGRDYFETTLMEHSFDCVFSNPPYSCFVDWCLKLVSEVNSKLIYLVIPSRWQNNSRLVSAFSKKGSVDVIGSYDFTSGLREARCTVDVIRIVPVRGRDTFCDWVSSHLGDFESNSEIDFSLPIEDSLGNPLGEVEALVEGYKRDLEGMMLNYKTLGGLDFSLLSQLGLNRDSVISTIRKNVVSLKNKYWQLAFDTLSEIRSRLTIANRRSLLTDISWFSKLDFNFNNIYTVVIWVIEHVNDFTVSQMLKLYADLTKMSNLKAYKSNERWLNDNWRYGKDGIPEKYTLDYRVIVSSYSTCYRHSEVNIIEDMQAVARSLGFISSSEVSIEVGKHSCLLESGEVLFEYKIYKNHNIHFKLNKDFLQALNIEVGKLKGWLKKPEDIMNEFKVSKKEAQEYMLHGKLLKLSEDSQLKLTL